MHMFTYTLILVWMGQRSGNASTGYRSTPVGLFSEPSHIYLIPVNFNVRSIFQKVVKCLNKMKHSAEVKIPLPRPHRNCSEI